MKSIQYALSLILMLSIIGCSKDKNIVDDTAQFELDKQLIRNYLKDNNLNADSTSEGSIILLIILMTHCLINMLQFHLL